MLGGRLGHKLAEQEVEEILAGMRRLPAHPDVAEALANLKASGFRQVTLTNSPLDVVRDQLAYAGLDDLVDDVLSADEVRQLKPGPKPYHLVAERMGVDIAAVRLIAAHAWDVSGALAAGARAVFVARAGVVPSPLGAQPDMVVEGLHELANRLRAA
jgi:2-haloacid dehalogenase